VYQFAGLVLKGQAGGPRLLTGIRSCGWRYVVRVVPRRAAFLLALGTLPISAC